MSCLDYSKIYFHSNALHKTIIFSLGSNRPYIPCYTGPLAPDSDCECKSPNEAPANLYQVLIFYSVGILGYGFQASNTSGLYDCWLAWLLNWTI